MANENITRVTADATGYVAELDKASRSAAAFAESNEAASARVAAAQAAVSEATANGSDASTRAINSFINSLARQSDAAGKSATELLRQRAAVLGVTDAAEPFIAHMESVAQATRDAADAAKAKTASDRAAAAAQAATAAAAERAAADTRKFVDAVNAEAAAIGKTRAELLQLQAAQKGVSGDVSAAIAKIQAHAEATAVASHNTHEFSLESAGARRELLVLGHELSQGSIKNFAGSLLALAERSNAMNLIFNKTVLSVAAVVAVLAGTAEIALKTAENLTAYGNAVNTISRATGLSTTSIQQFGFEASTVGVSMKDASDALNNLTKSQNEAIHGNKDAAAAYKALGISLSDLKSTTPADLLLKVEDAFSRTADGAGKAAVANELFGSNAEALIPLLDQGAAGAEHLNAAFVASGGALSGQTIAALAEFEERLKTSQAAMSNVNRTASLALLPTIVNLTDAFVTNAGTSPLLISFYEGLAGIIKGVVSVVATATAAVMDFNTIVDTVISVAAHGLRGEWSEAVAAGKDGMDKIMNNGNNYAAFMKKIWADSLPPTSQTANPSLPQVSYAKGQNSVPKTNEDPLNAQMRDLKEQLDAREKLISASVDHVRALQQQGVIDAATAIQQEHDTRAAGYADELAFADKGIEVAQHKRQTAALVEWQAKKKAIQALIAKNDAETADAQQTLQAKETNATQAYVDALNNALQVRAQAIATQNQGRTLGATDADDLARATAAAKEYSDKYAELTKARTENKISPTQYTAEIGALQTYETQRLALEQDATAKIKAMNADGFAGAQKAAADYAEDAANRFKQVGSVVTDIAQGMEDAWATFVTTGKLNFSSLASSVIADIARMQAKAAISGLFNFAINAVSGYFAGSVGEVTTAASDAASGVTASAVPNSAAGITTTKLASGGHVTGPGSGTSDDIAAWLSNGEFVVNAAQTSKHRSLLEAINSGGRINGLAKFATGGYVGPDTSSLNTAGGEGVSVTVPVSVQGGSDDNANASGAAKLQQGMQRLVRGYMQQELQQGGILWNMKMGRA